MCRHRASSKQRLLRPGGCKVEFLKKLDLEVTPIVGYGLVLIVLVFGWLGLEKMAMAASEVKTRLDSAQMELTTLNQIKETDVWPERLAASSEIKEAAIAKVWSGNTSGVIAAELQQTLRAKSTSNGATDVRVRVDPDADELNGVDILTFEYTGRVPAGKQIIDILTSIAAHEDAIIMTEMSLINSIRDKRPSQFNFSGVIPINTQADPGTTAQGGAQ